jgi:hypothetical protein
VKLRTCYFGSLTITISKIKEMEEKCYSEGEARAPGAETVPEPNGDEASIYEDFFITDLCMPSQLALTDNLLHLQAQLHQLTPNTIVLLLKFFWVVGSFVGVPSGNLFMKCYELHYQPKTWSTAFIA